MKCYLCGSEISNTATSCHVCGAPVIADQPLNQQTTNYSGQQNAGNNAGTYQQQYGQQPYQQPYNPQYQQAQPYQQSYTPQYQQPYAPQTRQLAPVNENNNLRTIALVLGILGVLLAGVSIFIPFFTVSAYGLSKSVALSSGRDGFIVAGLAAVTLIIVIFARKTRGIGHLVFGTLLGVVAFIDGINNKSKLDTMGYGSLVNYGIGFYVLLGAAIMILASGVLLLVAKNKE